MDIEFIICWEDRTWTTEVYFTPVPTLSHKIDYDKICTERMEKIIKEIIWSRPINGCPRGGPVHVGIYHINEECSY